MYVIVENAWSRAHVRAIRVQYSRWHIPRGTHAAHASYICFLVHFSFHSFSPSSIVVLFMYVFIYIVKEEASNPLLSPSTYLFIPPKSSCFQLVLRYLIWNLGCKYYVNFVAYCDTTSHIDKSNKYPLVYKNELMYL